MRYEPLDQGLGNELKSIAEHSNFRHVINIVDQLMSLDGENISTFDKEHILMFLKYIKIKAALQYPYWNDDLSSYDEHDGDEYLEVINGIYSGFATWLYDELHLSNEA